jgi:simple sugar transport system permease protein
MSAFIAALLDATLRATTALLLACLGELIAERAGILNLGVEGMMLIGALTGFITTVITGNPYLGFAVGALAGGISSLLHAFLCISLKADQVISGLMLTILGTGATTYFGTAWVDKSITGFQEVSIPFIGETLVAIPIIGEAFFSNMPTDYLALVMTVLVWYFLYRTNIGMELSAIGEDPEAADSVGVSVFKLRYLAVIIGGIFAGAAGAHLSLAYSQLWIPEMTAGRGWIAVALVIFAQWRPSRALVGAVLFGGLDALVLRANSISLSIDTGLPLAQQVNEVLVLLTNPSIMSTYPYIVTILILYVMNKGILSQYSAEPESLTQPYTSEID